MQIPCKGCICYPICKQTVTIVPLLRKCSILASYTKNKDIALEVIEFFKPTYYTHDYSAISKRTLIRENIEKIRKAADQFRGSDE